MEPTVDKLNSEEFDRVLILSDISVLFSIDEEESVQIKILDAPSL